MAHLLLLLYLTILSSCLASSTSTYGQQRKSIAHIPNSTTTATQSYQRRQKRQTTSIVSTCGYYNGDPKSSRTAESGFGCSVNTSNGLWGFCPTNVREATDCGLAGYCEDRHSCKNGCGRLSNRPEIATITCESKHFCSTALLINGPNQSFEYIACGGAFTTERLLAVPSAVTATTTASPRILSKVTISEPTQSSPSPTSGFFTSRSSSSVSSISYTKPSEAPSNTTPPLPILSVSTESLNLEPANNNHTNISAIMGGTVAGIVVICATILGLYFIHQKREGFRDPPALLPPRYSQSWEFRDSKLVEARLVQIPKLVQKSSRWNSSYGPVEMAAYERHTSPIELPAGRMM
ncbi:hypothetical protein K504DRAFT_533079 [Pleomassaria siparia CBS 279.74]|uniref:Mid2 domain-containing protein n=1 Tax=Pleomassaria siparia CBS 279.74 TaxID=1314801 RepID=A0A6G1KC22_9PLEO|nr:hypothetical protein K504DRAFT_533079 [Pleomassaria siparia CBS 279.74]